MRILKNDPPLSAKAHGARSCVTWLAARAVQAVFEPREVGGASSLAPRAFPLSGPVPFQSPSYFSPNTRFLF